MRVSGESVAHGVGLVVWGLASLLLVLTCDLLDFNEAVARTSVMFQGAPRRGEGR